MNALKLDWSQWRQCLAFPPPILLPSVLEKINSSSSTKASIILIFGLEVNNFVFDDSNSSSSSLSSSVSSGSGYILRNIKQRVNRINSYSDTTTMEVGDYSTFQSHVKSIINTQKPSITELFMSSRQHQPSLNVKPVTYNHDRYPKVGPSSAKYDEIWDANLVFRYLATVNIYPKFMYNSLLHKTLVLYKMFGLARSFDLVKWSFNALKVTADSIKGPVINSKEQRNTKSADISILVNIQEGFKSVLDKIGANNLLETTTVTEVRALEAANYLRKFIPNYWELTAKLATLTDIGTACVIMQDDGDGNIRLILYEKNYSTTDREFLTLVNLYMLKNKKFRVFTDHLNLKEPSKRINRDYLEYQKKDLDWFTTFKKRDNEVEIDDLWDLLDAGTGTRDY
ncbi:hypothetical protein ACTFIU_011196 [Dictyostelium citrinum]